MDPISSLCNLASFVTNSERLLTLDRPVSSTVVSVPARLLSSGGEIDHLTLVGELPDAESCELLCSQVKQSRALRSLTVTSCYNEYALLLVQVAAAAALNTGLVCLDVFYLHLGAEETKMLGKSLGPSLSQLAVGACRFKADAVAGFAEDIGKSKSPITSVRFSRNDLDGESILALIAGLSKLPHLRELTLRGEKPGIPGMMALGQLCLQQKLRALDFGDSAHEEADIAAFADACLSGTGNLALEKLVLDGKSFGKTVDAKLARLFRRTPRLSSLVIRSRYHGEEAAEDVSVKRIAGGADERCCDSAKGFPNGATLILAALLHDAHVPLTSLTLDSIAVGYAGACVISDFLPAARIVELEIHYSGVQGAGAVELAKAIKKAHMLRSLNISSNKLGPMGATAIVDSLQTRRQMEMLNLDCCDIRGEGAAAVARAILRIGFRTVHLGNNGIRAEELVAVMDATEKSATIVESLDLSYNGDIDNPSGAGLAANYVAEKIAAGKISVRRLNIENIGLGDVGAKAIVHALRSCSPHHDMMLEELIVSAGDCGDDGTNEMNAEQRRENPRSVLNITDNKFY